MKACASRSLLVLVVSGSSLALGASAEDPFTLYLGVGGAYDDNLFRLDEEPGVATDFPIANVEDWYGYGEFGFESRGLGGLPVTASGRIYRHDYDEMTFLDHTGGAFDIEFDWGDADRLGGDVDYRYRRRLQGFTNKLVPVKDIIEENRIGASLERSLGLRSRIEVGGSVRDLSFSTSEFLDKSEWDARVHYEFAASRSSHVGLLATFEQADFDESDIRDYSGWFLGPTITWQSTESFRLESNLGWTERELDDPDAGLADFDGLTGSLSFDWKPGRRFSLNATAFRDVSSLGGEISNYTDRIGVHIRPRWRLSEQWTLRVSGTYEDRDFEPALGQTFHRQDDYYLASLDLVWDLGRRIEVTFGYDFEYRTSNEDIREFSDNVARLGFRLNL